MRELFGENYYDIEETASLLGLKPDTIRQWCRTKWNDEARKIGKEWLIPERVIRELVNP